MKKFLFALLAFSLVKFGFSQTDFREGFIIKAPGDTISGLVNFREGAKAYKTCEFKESADREVVTYLPAEIVGYGFVNDRVFESRKVEEKDQPAAAVFAELIVKGLVSLYRVDNIFFVEKNDSGFYKLDDSELEVYIDGRKVIKSPNKHIGTLNSLMFDCSKLRTRIQKVTLTEIVLTALVEDYNACNNAPSVTHKNAKPWVKTHFGIATGLNISKIQFETSSSEYEYLLGSIDPSFTPTIGVSFEILSPRFSERIAFHSDVTYTFSSYDHSTYFHEGNREEWNNVSIALHQLKIPMGFRYTFPEKKVTPYFNLGFSATIHLSSDVVLKQKVEVNNVVNTSTSEPFEVKRSQLGVWGGFGLSRSINQKMTGFVEFRYEKTDGICDDSWDAFANLRSQISNFQILIGIRTR